jgi:hypothetical protein
MNDVSLKSLKVGADARDIAVRQREGKGPGLFWLGGFKSDMKGTKAEALDLWAAKQGRACTRFDYSGHGESGGDFAEGHNRAVARGQRRGVQAILPRAANRDRLIHGRVDGAPARARTQSSGQSRRRRRPASQPWC